ncbi:MAG: D-sedoheptulose-7-phosphate isomerase [Mycobacteriales bacterium]
MSAPFGQVDPAIGSLYPFLGTAPPDLPKILEDLRSSTVAKVAEIVELRARLVHRDAARLYACAQQMAAAFLAGGRLYAFGNGGSSTDAQAVTTVFRHPGRDYLALPAFSLTDDVAVLTALANDVSYQVVFARQLEVFARPGDIAFALSTSGGSANVLAALDEAHRRGMLTVGLAGHDGGRMAQADSIDHLFVVPSASVHRIQEAQSTVYHLLWGLTVQILSEASSG